MPANSRGATGHSGCFVIAVSDAHPTMLRFIHNPGSES